MLFSHNTERFSHAYAAFHLRLSKTLDVLPVKLLNYFAGLLGVNSEYWPFRWIKTILLNIKLSKWIANFRLYTDNMIILACKIAA